MIDISQVSVIIVVLLTSIFLAGSIFVLERRKFFTGEKIILSHSDLQKTILQGQLEIQEQTFHYVSQEIHDHIGQRLTLARLYLNSRKGIPVSDLEDLLDDSSRLISEAITDLKCLSRSITSSFIEEEKLVNAVQLELERISKHVPIVFTLKTEGEIVLLPAETELMIFRMVQESLQNIMKHAEATVVYIILKYESSGLRVSITDNGKGFDTRNPKINSGSSNLGLPGMKKRAQLLNGSFSIHSSPGNGTTVQILLPINH
jgi:signal transduction histidine kinase